MNNQQKVREAQAYSRAAAKADAMVDRLERAVDRADDRAAIAHQRMLKAIAASEAAQRRAGDAYQRLLRADRLDAKAHAAAEAAKVAFHAAMDATHGLQADRKVGP